MAENLVLICGSRELADEQEVAQAILQRVGDLVDDDTLIMCGDARGVDRMASESAKYWGSFPVVVKADWKKHGRKAGILRNLAMINRRPKLVIAYWNGSSPGTAHTIGESRARGIPVEVHRV